MIQDQLILYDVGYELYEGSLKDRSVCIKKYRVIAIGSVIKDIVIGSQKSIMSMLLSAPISYRLI
jgi:hypothetical protein